MLHELLRTWFEWVQAGGYWGIAGLMALESSIVPVPSEIVMAPAGFWAAQESMSFAGVVLAGTLGSYVGSIVSYWVAFWLGRPLLEKYGKYVLLPKSKLEMAEKWIQRFGTVGIFTARFLPVVRHLISIPAGLFRMPLMGFSGATILGAGIWCAVLAWFGGEVLGNSPELLQSPALMVAVIQAKMHWFVSAALMLAGLYGVVVWFKSR